MRYLLVVLALLVPASSPAQSLSDAAAREKARRKEQEAKSKPHSYSNEDLGPEQKDKKPKSGEETQGAPAAALGPVMPAQSDEEKIWRSRAESARGAVKKAEDRVAGLDAKAKELLNQRILSTDTNEILRLMAEQKDVLDELGTARQDVEAAKKALEEFEQSARAASVPPQWIE